MQYPHPASEEPKSIAQLNAMRLAMLRQTGYTISPHCLLQLIVLIEADLHVAYITGLEHNDATRPEDPVPPVVPGPGL